MKKKINKQLILSSLICFIPFIISIYFYNRLPEQVVIHIDSYGNPDNYAPKFMAVFGIPLLMLCIHLYTWFRLENEPKKNGFSKMLQEISKWGVAVLSVALELMIVMYAIGITFKFNFVALFTGILIFILGNYLPKCRQNYTLGIKLPWTLANEENWNKTHHLAGWIWIVGGILLVINAFTSIPFASIIVILSIVIVPFVYSYMMYKESAKSN